MYLVSLHMYVNFAHFFFLLSCSCFSLLLQILFRVSVSYLLLLTMCLTVSISFCLFCLVEIVGVSPINVVSYGGHFLFHWMT